jgi:hypothetical protein
VRVADYDERAFSWVVLALTTTTTTTATTTAQAEAGMRALRTVAQLAALVLRMLRRKQHLACKLQWGVGGEGKWRTGKSTTMLSYECPL